MPQFTVYIEEDTEEDGKEPYIFDTYTTLEEAIRCCRAAEISYPNGAVWVEDENGNVVPREDLAGPNPDPDLSYIPPGPEDDLPPNPGDDFYTCQPDLDDPFYEQGSADVLEVLRKECPHNWQKMGDGLFHCTIGCGVPPHEPHPGETND